MTKGAVANHRIMPIHIIVLWVSSCIIPLKTSMDGTIVASNPIYEIPLINVCMMVSLSYTLFLHHLAAYNIYDGGNEPSGNGYEEYRHIELKIQ